MADDKDDREQDADELEDEREDDEQAESAEDRTAASDDADESEDGEGSDAAARRVAEALGVGEDEDEEAEAEAKAAAEEAEDAPKNRAARRREQAEGRRKKRRGAAAKAAEEPLPKDKNARAKELLKRRREQVTANVSSQLLPSEMVDDALARGTSAVTRWLRSNFGAIQWFILAAIVAGGGFALYTSQTEKKAADATDTLMSGVHAQLGLVVPEDKAKEKENEDDEEARIIKTYKTAEERSEAALAGYQKVVGEYPNTAAAILAQLGEAGVLLRKGEAKKAIDAFNAVLASKLAAADLDVKGRALEGLGFAKEESGDLDGALASFKDLQAVDARGFKELGTYHEARVLLAKGDKDKAKELFKGLYEKFNAPDAQGPQSYYLKSMVMQELRQLDPEMLKQPGMGGPGGAGGKMSQEEIQRLLQEAIKKGQQQGQGQ